MAGDFDRLFSKLPSCMKRHEDGTAAADKSHPAVQQFLEALAEARRDGCTEEEIAHIVMSGFADGMRRAKEGQDGR